ncbi:RNA polymerase sigma factor [Bradyrhizobium sp. U87765 SZCCT0131]|uniref:RNA polymerase sigma factor n=1 Tax=unclassified Bradyrhizobium TaxID=2631580 RepID=UPI001BA8FB95|nr:MULTISPECIES: RNA polymerase sigma factor [unclassified Bradyrhizobium]MBR1220563.1 RNA polymerase sigma factor [Bradyrhizobium sp. U87765 SZCCT0131]MBR1262983.1 RNA polymerase sigma factor [Bradyrhizobium sp. U87765 SZCCT0134]MBR1307135.1 RNA polymerase sigma factor [Bradyrhizobium sp. U87765 SZCCT0110]MBR1322978.1 RNA polymerase sigma factor [Bradyrhizobium sp. U87765 SZCCT0109]MBR1346089.1 RNA polymerase sigma factor [Bradyrhizobium sp. U87765 SZCCT0048]
MTESPLAALQRQLLLRYDDLKARLTRRLGSADAAGDALQDTWLRLQRGDSLASVRNQDAFLFRVAINIARDHLRADRRRLTTSEIDVLLNIADDTPDAARALEARSDIAVLRDIMAALPPRQREILLAARLDGLSRIEIAARFAISVRLVQRELQAAQDYCAARLRHARIGFTSGRRESSGEGDGSAATTTPAARPDDET